MTEALGPVEYLVVAFDGNRFKGEIVPALNELTDTGLIRIIDLAVISKDAPGNITIFEASELNDDVAQALARLNCEFAGMLSEEDLLLAAADLPNNCTAAAMLFENVWATRFAQAIRNADGEVLVNVRIPNDVVETVRQSFIEASKWVVAPASA
jgi:hypothetical protein